VPAPPTRPPMQHRNALPSGYELEEYRIDSVLGHGGFGITYLAWDQRLQQWVAVKEYLPNELAIREGATTVLAKSTADEEGFHWGLQRFILEARTLAHFKHPNIIRVLRFFERHGTAYMVMEYQEGCSLKEYCASRDTTEQELESILYPLLDGLEQVHNAGFLHRDIKPNNIYIRHNGVPVLLDFGSARFAVKSRSASLTSIVTPGYAPFEQYDTKSLQGPWTDIYSLGAVLYFIISGSAPQEVVSRIKRDEMPRAIDIGQDRFRRELLQAVDWALAVDEEARPQSIREWRDGLTATPLTQFPLPRAAKSKLGGNAVVLAAGLAVALAVAGVGYVLYPRAQLPATAQNTQITPALQNQVEAFIQNYIDTQARADLPAFIALFDDWVDYHSWGRVSRETVYNEKRQYWSKWPEIHYVLGGTIHIVRDSQYPELLHVDFPIKFQARAAVVANGSVPANGGVPDQGALVSTGTAVQIWQLRLTPNGLKIAKEAQRQINRLKSRE